MLARRETTGRTAGRRRGVAVLLVLLMLSITLGLSYAMVRSQNTASAIGRNFDRRMLAREAALTGLAMAVQKMYARDWGGVSTASRRSLFSKSLTAYESFSVEYKAGDPSLLTADGLIDETNSDCAKYPYRVTLSSTGTSVDPSDSQRVATWRALAVVQLVPQQLASEPSGWTYALDANKNFKYTLYQYSSWGSCTIPVPFRATGPMRFSTWLQFGHDYNWSNDAREAYLTGLFWMKTATADWRPLEGPVRMPTDWWSQEWGLTSLLSSMGIPTADSDYLTYSLSPSSAPATYRLYPGGPQYTVTTLSQDVTMAAGAISPWQPNMLTNPLGLFARAGNVNLYDNATIKGTVITTSGGDLNVYGKKVSVTSQDLLPLYGTTAVVRLPVAILQDDLHIYSGATGLMQGMATAGGTFEIAAAGQGDIGLSMQLRIAALSFVIRGRTDWDQTSTWWDQQYYGFTHQASEGRILYFPDYLQQKATPRLAAQPALVITPDTTAARYHWNALQNPVYDYPDSTHGLSWELVQWTDSP